MLHNEAAGCDQLQPGDGRRMVQQTQPARMRFRVIERANSAASNAHADWARNELLPWVTENLSRLLQVRCRSVWRLISVSQLLQVPRACR